MLLLCHSSFFHVHQAMRQVTEVRYMWEYRVIYFSLVFISQTVTFIFGISQKPCRRENFDWPFNYCMSLYFGGYMVDAGMLFLRCRARVKAQIWPRGRTARGLKHPMLSYLRHVAPFACLPICYALGVLLINAQKNMYVIILTNLCEERIASLYLLLLGHLLRPLLQLRVRLTISCLLARILQDGRGSEAHRLGVAVLRIFFAIKHHAAHHVAPSLP